MARVWKRTVYVYVDDANIWKRAKEYAEANNLSLSKLIALALADYLS